MFFDALLHILYLIFIFPFEFIFANIMHFYLAHLPVGYALLLLSLTVNILSYPMMRWAAKIENKERAKQFQVNQDIIAVKKEFKGEEAFRKIDAIYKKYHYSALLAFRADLSIFLSIPLFAAAIKTLHDNSIFEGVSFGPLTNLNAPDGLLFGINFLPIFMTLINLYAIKMYNGEQKFFDRANIKLIIIAVLFLIYLYDKSSALMVYWTSNNILSALKITFGMVNKHKEPVVK